MAYLHDLYHCCYLTLTERAPAAPIWMFRNIAYVLYSWMQVSILCPTAKPSSTWRFHLIRQTKLRTGTVTRIKISVKRMHALRQLCIYKPKSIHGCYTKALCSTRRCVWASGFLAIIPAFKDLVQQKHVHVFNTGTQYSINGIAHHEINGLFQMPRI